MRLPKFKLYRAFRELDAFSDEQCVRFMRAAKRGWARRLLHVFLICLAFAAGMVAGLLLIAFPMSRLEESRGQYVFSGVWGLLSAVAVFIWAALPPLAAFFTRDFLLRRRVRFVLKTRGACPLCRYSMAGLPVAGQDKVTCPECGTQTLAERSMGEIVADENGVERFLPAPPPVTRLGRVFTPELRRTVRRWTARVAAALAAIALIAAVSYEVFLRVQASRAARERTGSATLSEMMRGMQQAPTGASDGGENAWDLLERAYAGVSSRDAAVWLNQRSAYPDFSLVYTAWSSEWSLKQEDYDAQKEMALRMLREYREAGAFDELERMCRAPWATVDFVAPPNVPMGDVMLDIFGHARVLARINAARMHLAWEAGEREEMIAALESNLAIVRMCCSQPFATGGAVGAAVERLTHIRLREMLGHPRDAEWYAAIRGAMERQACRVPVEEWLESERIVSLDSVAWAFSDAGRARFGRLSTFARSLMDPANPSGLADPQTWECRLGTYAENKRFVEASIAGWKKQQKLALWERAPGRDPQTDLVLMNVYQPLPEHILRATNAAMVDRLGTSVVLALESFRARTGGYPDSLERLAPTELSSLPLDPWSGQNFRYRTTPEGDYLLYSVGSDLKDDAGAGSPDSVAYWVIGGSFGGRLGPTGYDVVLHEPPAVEPAPGE